MQRHARRAVRGRVPFACEAPAFADHMSARCKVVPQHGVIYAFGAHLRTPNMYGPCKSALAIFWALQGVNMRKIIRSTLVSLAIVSIATVAFALNPLGVQVASVSTPGTTTGGGGTFVTSSNGSCSSGSLAASVTVNMYHDSASPSVHYRFRYIIENTGSVSIDKVTTKTYQDAGSLPNVDFRNNLGGSGSPSSATRTGGAGDGDIDWDFSADPITSGNTGKPPFANTWCKSYQTTNGSVTVYSGTTMACTVSSLLNPYHAGAGTSCTE